MPANSAAGCSPDRSATSRAPFAVRPGYADGMPIGAQPPGRRGTVDKPYSALNLRLVLATFSLISSAIFAVLLLRADIRVFGWTFAVLAVVAAVDVVVIQLRRRARGRARGGIERRVVMR